MNVSCICCSYLRKLLLDTTRPTCCSCRLGTKVESALEGTSPYVYWLFGDSRLVALRLAKLDFNCGLCLCISCILLKTVFKSAAVNFPCSL